MTKQKKYFENLKKEVEADYSKAIHEQEQTAARNQLPIFWILLILIFAFDEITFVLKNPFLILFLLLALAILFIGWKLNLGPIVIPVVLNAYTQFLSRLGQMLAGLGDHKKND